MLLSIVSGDDNIWSVEVDNLELLVGMLAVGVVIVEELNKGYYMTTNVDVSKYRLLREIEHDNIQMASKDKLYDDEYGMWIKSNIEPYYNLYKFNTNYFFQGVISMCNTFSVDFFDYIYGFPFDGYGNLYALSGYNMTSYLVVQDVFDLDDVEEEEKDDENIIQPLERTDDIITIMG
jgi:hypothetical protein